MTVDWEIVKQALELSQYNELAATALLQTAFGEGGGSSEQSVVYGRYGYTDELDPRDLDCRSHQFTDGKPTGIHLQVHVNPMKRFRVKRVELLQDDTSANVYFVGNIYPKGGVNAQLGSPYEGKDRGFHDRWEAKASPNAIPMGKNSVFFDPNLGPYAAFLADDLDNIISDVVGSIGLLRGQHWSFRIYFEER